MRDSGILKLYELTNVATPGFMPTEKLVYKDEYFFSKVATGITRRYAALGANRNYSGVVRLWNVTALPVGVKYAVDEDSVQYRIDFDDAKHDSDSLELTLVRLEDFYDLEVQTNVSTE